jgi:hypothetical protein
MPRAPRAFRLSIILVVACCFLFAQGTAAQGFEKLGLKKKITLHRRLPAVIHFTGTKIQVRVTAKDPKRADVASTLKDRLETEILKSNPHFEIDDKSPELIIACEVTSFDMPPEQDYVQNVTTTVKTPANAQGKQQTQLASVPVKYKKYRGTMDVSYQAHDRSRHQLDAKNVSTKYSEDFEAATNQPVNKSTVDKMEDPFKRMFGKKTEAPSGPPSPTELQNKLIDEAVDQIVPRITTTNETIEVLLARGKLDDANKSAEGGLWTRYLEQLEQMTPFPKTKDDAYRLYDIGVAYEAIGYQSESEEAAKKSLQEAAINYGKAVDAKPEEKNFIEPQKRIETAMSYLRKLEGERKAFEAENSGPAKSATASSAPPASGGAAASSGSAGAGKTTDKTPGKTHNSTGTNAKTPPSTDASADAGAAPAPASPTKTPAKTQPPKSVKALTNDDIIKMAKEHVDDDTIIASIHDAAAVDFDLSPDGNIALTHGGVSKTVLAAMRARAKTPNRHTSNPGGT